MPTHLISDGELARALTADGGAALGPWSLGGASAEPLGGGMNSATALLHDGPHRLVAKWVSAEREAALRSGAALAARLAAEGLRTGPSLPTRDGDPVAPVAGGWCTVMVHVPGEPLTGVGGEEQRAIGALLGRVHRSTLEPTPPRWGLLDWLDPTHPALDVEAWIRPAVAAARTAYVDLRDRVPLTTAWLHTDPAPEAFHRDPVDGTTGLIDWTGAEVGPVLYDVASAVMYLGGPDRARTFLTAYDGAGVLAPGESAHLGVFGRVRWAVQAAYFARRLAADDLTGTDADGNAAGLADARRGLLAGPAVDGLA